MDKLSITRDELQKLYNEFYDNEYSLLSKQNTQVYWTKGKNTSLLLDELNRAPLDVKQSALQLVLEKEIHQHSLPFFRGKPSLIMACVNPADGNYQVDALDPALLDRFLTIEVQADAESWLRWATKKGLHKAVLSFISNNPDKLNFMSDEVQDSKFPTPRAWEKLSDLLKVLKGGKENPFALTIIRGKIGESIGSRFYEFYTRFNEQITYDDLKKFIYNQQGNDIKDITRNLKLFLANQNSMFKTEMLNLFCERELIKGISEKEALGTIAMLHAVELEIRASILKSMKVNNGDRFKIFLSIDKDRELICSITDHIV
jgi:hypothetical protein